MKRVLLLMVAFFGFVLITSAQSTPRVNQTQRNQVNRIRQGNQSGELNRRETANLAREQNQIQNQKRLAKSDGIVTNRERRQIKKEQRLTSRNIYRQKHDAQKKD